MTTVGGSNLGIHALHHPTKCIEKGIRGKGACPIASVSKRGLLPDRAGGRGRAARVPGMPYDAAWPEEKEGVEKEDTGSEGKKAGLLKGSKRENMERRE